MKRYLTLAASAAIFAALPLAAQTAAAEKEKKEYPSPPEIVAKAKAEEWVAIAPSDLIVMELAPDAKGKSRRVIIQLMPAPFSQGWVGNIRKLAAEKWWDGTAVVRVQDNYVAQWGDPTEKKALPEGLAAVPESEYLRKVPDEEELQAGRFELIDSYGQAVDFVSGFPVAQLGDYWWPTHCYGMVGVGRNLSPDT
ncbi:MAG: peptidylprolyl isomerase, partial [Sphingorhabdus sp.]|uniref:peptidylprolyl isomerase n=1 Tax=Sphingorhabdus sp. TaxID=1902408 RepID=UPI003C95D763